MKLATSVLLAAALAVASARQTMSTVHADRLDQYVRGARADAATPLRLTVAVRQRNTRKMEETLFAVSDPTSARYGEHLTKAQADDMLRPAPKSVRIVEKWLSNHGMAVASRSANSDVIVVDTTVAKAEELLETQYHTFKPRPDVLLAPTTAFDLVRCESYSVPSAVAAVIDFVGPTTHFPLIQTGRRSIPKTPDFPESFGNTPSSVKTLYQVPSTAKVSNGAKLAIGSFIGQYISLTDLASFFTQFMPSASGTTPTIFGKNDASNPGLEASLDVQWSMSVAVGVHEDVFSVPNPKNPNAPGNTIMFDFASDLLALNDSAIPHVVSVSYGENENEIDESYTQRLNTAFATLGSRGVSVLYASGDGGVSGSQPGPCKGGRFQTTYPGASGLVTSVGATTLGLFGSGPETAASLSAGGFSNYYGRPSYQDAAVQGYLSSGVTLPPASKFNKTGAAYPTVASLGTGFNIIVDGSDELVDGTSCASPTFAAMLALVTDARLAAGKKPLGFLNPWIFQSGSTFLNDITSGTNPGCNSNGFSATKGWDPVTGFGTANYPEMLKAALALP